MFPFIHLKDSSTIAFLRIFLKGFSTFTFDYFSLKDFNDLLVVLIRSVRAAFISSILLCRLICESQLI